MFALNHPVQDQLILGNGAWDCGLDVSGSETTFQLPDKSICSTDNSTVWICLMHCFYELMCLLCDLTAVGVTEVGSTMQIEGKA
jgi:hypothetical protein